MCPKCKNYGPQAEICKICADPRFYYGNEVEDIDSIILLSRLLAKTIAHEPNNDFSSMYADALLNFYIAEYWDTRSDYTNRY